MQSVLVLVPHHLHPIAAMREVQGLLGHQWLIALVYLAQRTEQKLTQLHLHMGFHGLGIRARTNATDQIQPLQGGFLEERAGGGNQWLIVEGNKKSRRPALNAIAKESRGSNPDHSEWLSVDHDARPADYLVRADLFLP